MKTVSKFHKFWEDNRNPITMKRCADENKLHIHNQSKEYQVALSNKRVDYTEDNSIINQ